MKVSDGRFPSSRYAKGRKFFIFRPIESGSVEPFPATSRRATLDKLKTASRE
jgi:hypothetical protein